MHYSYEKRWILCFIPLIIVNQAELCHKFPSRVNPEVLCNGFANLLRLDNVPDNNINKLSFSKNNITAIDSSSFNEILNSVADIYLDNNLITHISANAFKNLPNLQTIDLSNNKLEVLDPETFTSNNELTTIDLAGNKIKILNVNLVKKLQNLEKLILSNNPLEVCDQTTAESLRYLEAREIKTLFLPTCDEPSTTETKPNTTIAKNGTVDVKIDDVENNDIVEKFVPLMVILSGMVVVAVGLGYLIATLCLKLSNKNKSGRLRTESGNYLLSKDSQHCSTISGVDENGYMVPVTPQDPPKYVVVLGDSSQAPLISINSENDLRKSKILNCPTIPVPHIPTVLNSQEPTYQPNHVYEEIQERNNFYEKNLPQYLSQPYSCVKNVHGK